MPAGGAAVAAFAIVVGCFFLRAPVLERVFTVKGGAPVPFKTLKFSPKPNQYLVCPEDYAGEAPHRKSPVFDIPASRLKAAWESMIEDEPRVEIRSESGAQTTYVQRTRLMRYPDLISVEFVALSEKTSAIAVFSRSIYGHSDLGANKKRVEDWLSKL